MSSYSNQSKESVLSSTQRPVMFSLPVFLLLLNCFVSFGQTITDTVAKSKPPQRPGARAEVPDVLPGKGLGQHDFLYAGGWDTRKDTQTIFRVIKGKVVWTWSIPIKDRNGVL